ncbi:hypothetical protein [Ferruginibacter sp. SUN106]|uniref:hypothetical protein n=1 Tax=Ferruginibacter sp. SUN106 TaxID=2978348 RepID=UPI003D367C8C
MANNTKNIILSFFSNFSKLFNIGLRKKRFEIVSTSDSLYASNTSRSTFFAIIFTLFGSCHLVTGFIEYYTAKGQVEIDFFIAFGILFLIGLLCFRQFLWFVFGKQELTIQNGQLTLQKKGTFFVKPHYYLVENITNVRQGINEEHLTELEKIQLNISLNRKVLFIQIFGQVLFDYNGKKIKIFNDLKQEERIQLIQEINKRK